jgi:hypothetical protein
MSGGIVIGSSVTIAAADDFFAFIDGWEGRVTGFNNGLAEVVCFREDGQKTFYVPPDQLRSVHGKA